MFNLKGEQVSVFYFPIATRHDSDTLRRGTRLGQVVFKGVHRLGAERRALA